MIMNIAMKPIKAKRFSDQVFDQIKDLIYGGELKPGTRLMAERELAEAMDVSRAVVREALQRLAAIGLLVQQQGRGTFINDQDSSRFSFLPDEIDAQGASVKDFIEIRMGFECNAAFLAAIRAERSDIKSMEKSIERMEIQATNGRFDVDADIAFHTAIAIASKNPLHAMIKHTFNFRMFEGIHSNIDCLSEYPGNIEKVFSQHKMIFEQIKNRNCVLAFDAMKLHINFLLEFLKTCPG